MFKSESTHLAIPNKATSNRYYCVELLLVCSPVIPTKQ